MSIIAQKASDVPSLNYSLVVGSGEGDGVYLSGSIVTITADTPADGFIFDTWTGDTVAVPSSPSTTITMTGNLTVTATYVSAQPATYTLTVVSGSGDGNYEAGAVQAIVADAPVAGQVFSAWTGGGGAVASPSSASTTVTMPASALTVTATYVNAASVTLTVNSGTGSGSYLTGETALIVADAPATGKVFDVWTGDTVASASSPSTSILMSGNKTVTATYANTGGPLYTLTVVHGNGSGNYLEASVNPIAANSPAAGMVFDAWTGDTSALTSPSSSSTNATMPAAAVTVTATYTSAPTYVLTVVNGSGDGTYPSGTVVTITADAPAGGQVFNGWTGASVADSSAASTTITVTGTTTVTATYTAAATFTLTVINGTGGGNFAAASVHAVTANAPAVGKVFSAWTGDTANLANAAASPTNCTMPSAAVTVTATYADLPTYVLTVVNGSGDGSYLSGTVVTITADTPAAGQVFSLWTGATVASASSPSTTITVTGTTTVTATYTTTPPATYTLTVQHGSGTGNYAAAHVQAIVADAAQPGYVFGYWTGDTSYVANVNASSTTVTMPAGPVFVSAFNVAGPTYTLTVNFGTGDGSYLEGSVNTIVADAPATGKVFSAWTGGTVANASSPSTTVTMPAAAVTVTATYVDNPVLYTLGVTSGSGDGNYSGNTVVSIVADAPAVGKAFAFWSGGGSSIANAGAASTTVTMPFANLTVAAQYSDVPIVGTYYVATNGSDSNPGTFASPFRTIKHGVSILGPSYTLLVRGGTYDEGLDSCPSGTSWANKVRIANYNNETVTMFPQTPQLGNPGACILFESGSEHYIEFDGINMNGSLAGVFDTVALKATNLGEPHHVRIQNATITAFTGDNSVYGASEGAMGIEYHGAKPVLIGGFEFINLTITGGGRPGTGSFVENGYGIYLAGPNNVVAGCIIYDNKGAGIQIFNDDGGSPDNNTVKNCRIFNQSRNANIGQLYGIICYGNNNQLYNNLIYNISGPGSDPGGQGLAIAGTSTQVLDNTVSACFREGIIIAGSSNVARNNISYGNGTDYSNIGSGTTHSNSIDNGTNPLFRDAGASDYRVFGTSPAVGAGIGISYIPIDFVGAPRPTSGPCTAGAYEDVVMTGTWTPVIGGTTSESGQVYSSQYGTYRVFGGMCFLRGYIQFSNAGTITGFLRLKGLPFPTANLPTFFGGDITYFSNVQPSTGPLKLQIGGAQSVADIYNVAVPGSNPVRASGTATVNNSTQMIIVFDYFIDT